MMKIHELKIKPEYAYGVYFGRKKFELRKNDRDFQEGDLVKFKVVYDGNPNEDITTYWLNNLNEYLYRIIYVLKDVPEYGLGKDYCILGIARLVEER